MKKQTVSMGMLVKIQVTDSQVTNEDINEVFALFHYVDKKFSTYKKDSEISKINNGELKEKEFSNEMKRILSLCEKTKQETDGYFDINVNGKLDPSGVVKGYAILAGAKLLQKKRLKNIYVEIAGDIQVFGKNNNENGWKIGIQNPFSPNEIIKAVCLSDRGIATSGNYQRGKHIINPIENKMADEIASVTVIGPDILEADRFATAAFAMGEKGIEFINNLNGFEGYMIRKDGKALFTAGFEKYTV